MNEIKELLKHKLQAIYSDYPIVIEESPEDTGTLWVQVFAVPTSRVRELKNFIHDLEDEIWDGNEVVLLPMVKNLEVTRKYYAQYAPADKPIKTMAYGHFVETNNSYYNLAMSAQEQLKPLFSGSFGIDDIVTHIPNMHSEEFKSNRPEVKAADTELALAA